MFRLIVVMMFLVTSTWAKSSGKLTVDGNRFTYSLKIHSPFAAEKLFEQLCSDSTTLKLRGSAHSVEILANGQVKTLFRAFGYRAVTITEKEPIPDRHEITLTVKSFDHNWNAVPHVNSGVGLYRIDPADSGSELYYSQEVVLDRNISKLTELLIRWQLSPLADDIRHVAGLN